MMNDYPTRACPHCGKHSLRKGPRCPWCNRGYEETTLLYHIVALVAIVSMVATAWRIW